MLGLSLGARTDAASVLAALNRSLAIIEFDPMSRHKLPIVAVVMNNRSWAASQHFQEMVSGKNRVIGTQLGEARYHDVAKALGCEGVHVTEIGQLGPALRKAFESGRPTCINVEIEVNAMPPELHQLMARHDS